MTITEKVAYLRGMAAGLKLDTTTNDGQLLSAIIDTLEDMAFTIADVEDGLAEVCEQIDLIDEDLESLEEDFYDEFDDDDFDLGDDDFDFDDDEYYEVKCPTCGDIVCLDEDMLDEGEIHCPGCNEHLEFDFDCECEECTGEESSSH